jgi:hypothetical protein
VCSSYLHNHPNPPTHPSDRETTEYSYLYMYCWTILRVAASDGCELP